MPHARQQMCQSIRQNGEIEMHVSAASQPSRDPSAKAKVGRGAAQSCCSSSSHPSAVPHLQTHCPASKPPIAPQSDECSADRAFGMQDGKGSLGGYLNPLDLPQPCAPDRPFQRRFRCSQPVNRGSEIWQGVNKGGIAPGSPPLRLRTSSTRDLCFRPPHLAGRKGFDPSRLGISRALHHCLALKACSFGGAGIAGD